MTADGSKDNLIANLANAGASPSKIAHIIDSSVSHVMERLGALHLEAAPEDTASGDKDKADSADASASGEHGDDLQSEFDAIVAGTNLDDSALYLEGSKVVYVIETATPTQNGLEPIRCTGKLGEAKNHLFEEAIKDIRDNNGLRLRQGPITLNVNCVRVNVASQEHHVDQQIVASVGFQPAWFSKNATVALSDAESAAATALVTGIRDNDARAVKFLYTAPVTVPDMVDWSKGEYVGDESFM